MLKKFNLIFIFILLNVLMYSREEKYLKKIYVVINYNGYISEKNFLYVQYLVDKIREDVLSNSNDVKLIKDYESYGTTDIKQLINFVNNNNGSGLFFLSLTQDDSNLKLNLVLYNNVGEIIKDENILYDINKIEINNIENYNVIFEYFNRAIEIMEVKKNYLKTKNVLKKLTYQHDFPYINFYINAVSSKIYFDNRTNSKIFSFFPVGIFLTYFPYKYLETGLFIKFSFNDMVYKFLDKKTNNYDYFHTSFTLVYGLFVGLSFFFDIFHFSFGFNFYNIYYHLPENSKFKKTNDYRSYFLPQMSFYQKLDVKIFKLLNYSVYYVIKTIPEFIFDEYFFSEPFKYDFVAVEISILGFSITF